MAGAERPDEVRVPPRIDTTKPSIARAYDYMIGGKDHFASDRAVGDQIMRELPGAVAIAVDNRKTLVRAVRYLARDAGIRQFIDLGSGLPTADNVHQVAQRHAPESRVVYVDNDPVVLAYGRALLDENDRTTVVQADIREPREILDDPGVRGLIDFDRPVGVIMCAILHHLLDEEDPAGVVATFRDAVPSGSHLFLTHFCAGEGPEARHLEEKAHSTFGRGRWRRQEEIASYFDGFELVDPGIVPLVHWHPDEPLHREPTVWERLIVGGVGRKP